MRAHANTVADGDVLDIRADTDGLADNLVADNAGWIKSKSATEEETKSGHIGELCLR